MSDRSVRGVLVALAAAVLFFHSVPALSQTQSSGQALSIRQVDTSSFPTVKVVLSKVGPPPSLANVVLRDNGRIVPQFDLAPEETAGTPAAIVLAIDTSGSMHGRDAIGRVKAAADMFIASRPPNDRIAIIEFATRPRSVVGFTRDHALLTQTVDALAACCQTALWDAVTQASTELAQQDGAKRFLVVLTDASAGSFDDSSKASATTAQLAASRAGATVLTLAFPSGDVNLTPYQMLSQATGGVALATENPQDLGPAFSQLQASVRTQYDLTYKSPSPPGPLDLLVIAGDSQAHTTIQVATPTTTLPATSGGAGRGIRVVLIAAVLTAIVVGSVVFHRRRRTVR
ncbi:MAG TPA: VWA domain-containing protein [Acidimicrobiales bacterium]|nr:VWA domain-containing protein [Acidimicrobiales bacterium]